jgi:hypothetical protein
VLKTTTQGQAYTAKMVWDNPFWYVAVMYILVQKGFSLIVLPWIQGNNMEIIINSFDTKPLIRDFNLQPFDPYSGSQATTP